MKSIMKIILIFTFLYPSCQSDPLYCPALPAASACPPPLVTAYCLGTPGHGLAIGATQRCVTLVKKQTRNFYARYINGNIKTSGIRNCHLNIRSLKNKVFEVKNIVKQHSPHILGCSETELKKDANNIFDETVLKVPGYTALFPKSWSLHGY